MNQILEYSNINSGGNKKYSGGNRNSSDKIVKVFAIILFIFAVFLIVSGIMSFMKNRDTSEGTANSGATKTNQATIEAIPDEENEQVLIIVDHNIEISKIVYKWNSQKEHTISGDGQNHLEKPIDLPSGTSTLNIKVFDKNGGETSKSFTFETAVGTDIISPEITLGYQGNKLIITATDETELSFITYKWNDEQEITVEMDEDAEDKTTIVEEVDILMGENVISIVAVDASNNTKTESQEITGVTKPEIIVNLIGEGNGDTLQITCKHEEGVKEIYYTLNDRPYQWVAPEGENYPEVSFTQPLDEGYNRIKLKVTSVDDIPAEFDGECDYYPNGRPEEDESSQTTEDSDSQDAESTGDSDSAESSDE